MIYLFEKFIGQKVESFDREEAGINILIALYKENILLHCYELIRYKDQKLGYEYFNTKDKKWYKRNYNDKGGL